MTDASRLLRGTLPCLAALAVATVFVLPANAQPLTSAQPLANAAPAARTTGATRGTEWWLTALQVSRAWQAAPAKGNGVTVAVLSTGVAAASSDLTGAVTIGPDFSHSGRASGGPFWGFEGTAIASLIAGHGHGTGGTGGITGVAPRARILAVQVTLEYNDPLNSDLTVTKRLANAIAAGIRYAVIRGASVIALPLDPATLGPAATGDPAIAGGSPAERAAVGYALARNVVLIAPAGDNGAGTGRVNYPAAYPGVVAVGATQRGGQLAWFTSRLSYVALTAPGSGLTVADPAGGYSTLATTDLSAALTAGVAALIRSRFPVLSAAEVARALKAGARQAGGAKRAVPGSGSGALDAASALAAAAPLAAAHHTQPPRAAPTPSRPPATQHAAPRATVSQAGASAVAGTLLRDLVIAAGVLIVALACALALAVRRRHARFARQGPPRSRQGGSHARRPRTAQGKPRPPARSLTGVNGYSQGTGSTPRALGPARQPRALGAGSPGAPRVVPVEVSGSLAASSRGRRRRKPTGKPPWEPAAPPQAPLTTPAVLPALPAAKLPAANGQPTARQNAPLAPWERSPDAFAAAPVPTEVADWPATSTGPMYLWNPNATTAPQPAIPPAEPDDD